MAYYRLYCFDDQNHIIDRHDFDAENDMAAIRLMGAIYPGRRCEVWEFGRLVRAVEHKAA